jgi:hypothetical protein
VGGRHDIVEATCHDDMATLCQKPPDLLGLSGSIGPAPDHCDL